MGFGGLFKAVKTAAVAIEAIDAIGDTALLGDEIAKSVMGDDYDSAFRDKCAALGTAGKRVDTMVGRVRGRQIDLENMAKAVEGLNFRLDFSEFKNHQASELIDKVAEFETRFVKTPVAYLWVTGPAARTKSNPSVEELTEQMAAVREYESMISFNSGHVALLSTGLGLRALALAYRKRAALKDLANRKPITNRQRANAFSGLDDLPLKHQKAILGLRLESMKKLRRKITPAKVVDVVSKSGSAVSLGFTIKSIVDRVNTRSAAVEEMDRQIAEYARAEHAYDYSMRGHESGSTPAVSREAERYASLKEESAAIGGSTREPADVLEDLEKAAADLHKALLDDPAFLSAKGFFQFDASEQDGKERRWTPDDDVNFAFGLDGRLEVYNRLADALLDDMRELFDNMIAALKGPLQDDTPEGRRVAKYLEDDGQLSDLKTKREDFKRYETLARNRVLETQQRKSGGFDPIEMSFVSSLQKLLSDVVDEAADKLRDVRFASQLLARAERTVSDADEKERRSGEEAASRVEFVRDLLKRLGQPHDDAAVQKAMRGDFGGGPAETPFDRQAFVSRRSAEEAQSAWAISEHRTAPTKRFPDESAARDLVERMALELGSLGAYRLSDRYVWLDERHTLPLEFSCDFTINAEAAEFIPCFAKTRTAWNGENTETLSWYLSSARHDFTFRTRLFGATPAIERPTPGFDAEIGRRYAMRCRIEREKATYWIDGKPYAVATLSAGDVPDTGHIGFAVYGKTDVDVRNVLIESGNGGGARGGGTSHRRRAEEPEEALPPA